jgi:L,D-peptidoglycan transpeptidase YkuD (ErfK/YbiS/YcfS/YnhG family)
VSAAARPATTAQAQAQAPAPAAAPAPVRGQALPVGYDTGDATQVVTVTAPSTGSTYAKLSWWSKAPGGGWLRVGGPVTARVGDQGMTTNAHEGYDGTPMGGFTLTQAFGWAGNPGTGLPYITTDSNSWWIGHQGSTYNSYQHCSGCAAESQGDEHLSTVDVYRYAVVIDYNRFPAVYPRGSAFFLHIMNSQATAGCVSTDVNSLVSVMRWLNLGNHPRILIGVGQGG